MITPNLLKSAASVLALGAFAFTTASAQTLLLHYTFDEPSGPALDYGAGAPNPGTLQGAASRSTNAPAGLGNSVSFLGEPPYAHVLADNASKLNGLQQFTLTTWLNVSEYTAGNHRLMSQQASGNFGGFSFNMNATPNSGTVGPDNFRIGLFVGNGINSAAANFGSVFADADVDAHDQWVFLAVTYDGTSGATNFYIGGEAAAVAALGTPRNAVALTINAGETTRFGVGFTEAAPTADTSVIGFQDDIRVYSGVLDAAALDVVRMQNIPEPSTYAAIFGGLALLFAAGRRLRRNRS